MVEVWVYQSKNMDYFDQHKNPVSFFEEGVAEAFSQKNDIDYKMLPMQTLEMAVWGGQEGQTILWLEYAIVVAILKQTATLHKVL